jgi:hypothetical protein
MQREGNMRNGRATYYGSNGKMFDVSKGKGEVAKFLGGGAKASVIWDINGNNKVMIRG